MSVYLNPTLAATIFSSIPPVSLAESMGRPKKDNKGISEFFRGSCVIQQLNQFDKTLNRWMPDWILQKKIDTLGQYIEGKFSKLQGFSEWANDNGQGEWYKKLATALCKLPFVAAVNVVDQLYSLIKEIVSFPLHPLRGLNGIAKQFVAFILVLQHEHTWSLLGATMCGAAAAQGIFTAADPISTLMLGIGAALMVAGISIGALKCAVNACRSPDKKNVERFLHHLSLIPQALLTGFFTGALASSIPALSPKPLPNHRFEIPLVPPKWKLDCLPKMPFN